MCKINKESLLSFIVLLLSSILLLIVCLRAFNTKVIINENFVEYKNDEVLSNILFKDNDKITNIVFPEDDLGKYFSLYNFELLVKDTKNLINSDILDETGQIKCEDDLLSSQAKREVKKTINDLDYCLKASSEGAAGSVYTSYSYQTIVDRNIISFNFLAVYPQCGNFSEAERLECEQERESYDLDILVSDLINQII